MGQPCIGQGFTLTYSAEHDTSKVIMGIKKSQTRHVCGAYRPRLDNFVMDFVPSTTLYVNVRHHQFLCLIYTT